MVSQLQTDLRKVDVPLGGVLVVRVTMRMRIAVSCMRTRITLLRTRIRTTVLALQSKYIYHLYGIPLWIGGKQRMKGRNLGNSRKLESRNIKGCNL